MKLHSLNLVQKCVHFFSTTHSVYHWQLAKFSILNFLEVMGSWCLYYSFFHLQIQTVQLCSFCKFSHDFETYSRAMFLSQKRLDLLPLIEELK